MNSDNIVDVRNGCLGSVEFLSLHYLLLLIVLYASPSVYERRAGRALSQNLLLDILTGQLFFQLLYLAALHFGVIEVAQFKPALFDRLFIIVEDVLLLVRKLFSHLVNLLIVLNFVLAVY